MRLHLGRFFLGLMAMAAAVFVATANALWLGLSFTSYEVVFSVLPLVGIVDSLLGVLFLLLSVVSVRLIVFYSFVSIGASLWIVLSLVSYEMPWQRQGAIVVVLAFSIVFFLILALGRIFQRKRTF